MSKAEKTLRFENGHTLNSFLNRVMDEGIKSALAQKALTEKEKQGALSSNSQGGDDSSGGGVDDLFGGGGGGDDSGDGGDEEVTSSKTMDDETEKLQGGEIKAKDVVDKLNSIRSGKSFKDSAVSSSMEEYIDSLSKPEKVALLAFLKGIAQIVTGEVPAQNAEEPSDSPSDVQMQKGDEKKVVHKQPNVIKGGGGAGGGQQQKKPVNTGAGGAEDTSAPAPITPKRR
jgi:hypothetical protein